MGKPPELTIVRISSTTLLLAGGASVVAFCTLLPAKAPWVDELYTWYGIRHETFDHFVDSISSGINFSPPLYFFLNWQAQLVTPLSLDALRVESLLWVLSGAFLAHRAVRTTTGDLAAAVGVAIVLLQSALLREQALEARQYGMFFFCGAAVTLTGSRLLGEPSDHKRQALYFCTHLGLCFTHYLGIVFSGAAALAFMLARRKTTNIVHLPKLEALVWVPTIALNLLLLSKQSSHLNTWTKFNAPADLASLYLGSFMPLALALPFLVLLFTKGIAQPRGEKPSCEIKQAARSHIVLLSLFWLAIPTGAWLLSHLSELNLFKARYFMPKEVGWMLLLSILLSKLPKPDVQSLKNSLPQALLLAFSLIFLALATQRSLFALHPARDYHHRLLTDASVLHSSLPKVYAGDHLYFPNHHATQEESVSFLLTPSSQVDVYRRFSKKVKILRPKEAERLPEYLLITDKEHPNEFALPSSSHSLVRAYHLRGNNSTF